MFFTSQLTDKKVGVLLSMWDNCTTDEKDRVVADVAHFFAPKIGGPVGAAHEFYGSRPMLRAANCLEFSLNPGCPVPQVPYLGIFPVPDAFGSVAAARIWCGVRGPNLRQQD